MITMIDYGGSNLRSVQKAFESVGVTVGVTADPSEILRAEKLVLPGVGAFGAGMAALKDRGLDVAVKEAARSGTLLLGICLGMQFLFEESDEMGLHQGLGLMTGKVTRFPPMTLKIPHMGWNQIDHDGSHPLLNGVGSGAHTYFVHSYYCVPAEPKCIIAWTDYGFQFSSIVGSDNIYGIQFHPEKSQKVGLQIIKNFAQM